jgi:hypothetical protein
MYGTIRNSNGHDEVEAQQSEHLPHSTSVMVHKSRKEYEAKAAMLLVRE